MKTEDYKALTLFEKIVVDHLAQMNIYLKAVYNIISVEEAERNK